MNKKLLAHAFGHALLAFAYIFFIALCLKVTSKQSFSHVPEFFAPIIVLSLLVLSATIMAILIFGKPVLLYLDNKKKEALAMLFCTVGCLAAILLITVISVLIVY